MPQSLKLIAFLACLPTALTVTPPLVGIYPKRRAPPLVRDADGRMVVPPKAPPKNPAGTYVLIGVAIAGEIVLLIDALLRQYERPKALPVALAIFGLISLGLTSTLYYAVWGWLPTRRERALASQFCASCVGETLDKASPGAGTVNGVFGSIFVGLAERCPQCGSSIKTLWVFFLIPLFPIGSYRVLPVGKATFNRAWFISRKMPRLRGLQVWPLWLVSAAVVAAAVVGATHGAK